MFIMPLKFYKGANLFHYLQLNIYTISKWSDLLLLLVMLLTTSGKGFFFFLLIFFKLFGAIIVISPVLQSHD